MKEFYSGRIDNAYHGECYYSKEGFLYLYNPGRYSANQSKVKILTNEKIWKERIPHFFKPDEIITHREVEYKTIPVMYEKTNYNTFVDIITGDVCDYISNSTDKTDRNLIKIKDAYHISNNSIIEILQSLTKEEIMIYKSVMDKAKYFALEAKKQEERKLALERQRENFISDFRNNNRGR